MRQTPLGPRTCCRCGGPFDTASNERVCAPCRRPPVDRETDLLKPLTFRERQLIDLIREGKPNKEIAYHLRLSEGTVKEYLNRIFRKVGVDNRTQLAVWSFSKIVGSSTADGAPLPPLWRLCIAGPHLAALTQRPSL
jgi:DNA-binding CsgD family transcriptional regulator